MIARDVTIVQAAHQLGGDNVFTTCCLFGVSLSLAALPTPVAVEDAPLVEKYLHAGQYAEGEKVLLALLDTNPRDDGTRFGL